MLAQIFETCIQPIQDTVFNRIYGKSYQENCSISLDSLRYVTLSHYGFDGTIHTGELIMNSAIVDQTLAIFKELFEAKYPIEKMILVDEYEADDIRSMEDNNSSCFNYRMIDGTMKLSNHSMGLAIDINPLYNPYVRILDGKVKILPGNGTLYANRDRNCPYFIRKNDICYKSFLKHGFTWGGDWTDSKDYQHFEILL